MILKEKHNRKYPNISEGNYVDRVGVAGGWGGGEVGGEGVENL